jgi:hypothetical protein
MHIWTSSPIDEIWRQLRYLTSVANAKNLLLGNTSSGRESRWELADASRAATEISACVRQADEYFRAAEGVGLPTEPLLLFYGAESLAKATILASDSTKTLHSLAYHGLNTRPSTVNDADREILRAYVDNPASWTLEEEFAISHDGVFPNLCRICGDTAVKQGTTFRFKELVRTIPDLSDSFSRHYREKSHCVYLYSGPHVEDDGHLHVYFNAASHDVITSVFPEFDAGFEPVFMHESYPGFRKRDSGVDLAFAALEQGTIAGRYLVRPLPCGVHKSTSVLFAAMFVLSNVVRYKPAFWMDVIEGRTCGSVSVAESLCNVFERRFPNDVLDLIWHEKFTFGAPGYLS